MPSNKSSTTLSEKEMRMLASAWMCMDGEPKVNMDKLAELCGYTPGSARVMWGITKRKLQQISAIDDSSASKDGDKAGDDAGEAAATVGPSATPASGKKRKAATDRTKKGKKGDAGDNGHDADGNPTPTPKKARKTPTKKKTAVKKTAVKTEPEENEEVMNLADIVMAKEQVVTAGEASTEAPIKAPTKAPTEAPNEAPTEAPIEASTETLTETPTEAAAEGTTEEDPKA